MKKTISILAALAFIALFITACQKDYVEPDGLLKGFSFENDPVQFSPLALSSDSYAHEWTSKDAFDGERSLRITSTSLNNQSFASWWHTYTDFERGKPFKVRVRAKTVGFGTGGGIQVNMFGRNADRSEIVARGIGQTIESTNEEWQTIEVALETNPSETLATIDIYFLMLEGSRGAVYWDKLEIFTGE
ncbi:MAG: hypothetical protein AAGJ18_28720 [Bacteroidota bacterium]